MSKKPAHHQGYRAFVIFHGLWIFEVHDRGIRAHTNFEPEHIVCAGHFQKIGSTFADRTVRLPSGDLRITGVKPGSDLDFDPDLNVVLEERPFMEKFANRRFAMVHLPPPLCIHSLRNIDVPQSPMHPFAGVQGECLHPDLVSMVQAFEYHSATPPKIRLEPTKATPLIDGKNVKLHIYAEPPTTPDKYHARDAYTSLAEMFNLDIIPVAPMFAPAADPQVHGLKLEDMNMLMENLMPMPSIGVGSKGSNCDALVVDNRTRKSAAADHAT